MLVSKTAMGFWGTAEQYFMTSLFKYIQLIFIMKYMKNYTFIKDVKICVLY